MATPERPKILVAEDEEDLLEIIRFALESRFQLEVVTVRSGNRAVELLKRDPSYSLVVSDFAMPNGSGAVIYKHLREASLGIPFILCSSESHEQGEFVKSNTIDAFVAKPQIITPLQNAVAKVLKQRGGEVSDEEHSEYCRISTRVLLHFGVLGQDVYVRLAEDKFVRALYATDTFDASDLERFQAKQVDFLYVRRAHAPEMIARISQTLLEMRQLKTLSMPQGFAVSRSAVELISAITTKLQFPPEAQALATQAVELTVKTIGQNPKVEPLFEVFRQYHESYLPSHSTALAYLACALAARLGWTSEVTFFKLSIAAFLHDVTLRSDSLARLQGVFELTLKSDELSREEQALYLGHPEDSASLASQMTGVPAGADLLILQHHERPDGSGFPRALDALRIDPLSAVFIVAHDLLDFFLDEPGPVDLGRFLNERGSVYARGPFRDVARTLTDAVL